MKTGRQLWKKAAAGLLFLTLVWAGSSITSESGNVKADGMYVNLRFQLIEGKSVPDGETVFQISNRDFCNNLEEEKDTYVPDGVYRNISK